VLNELPDGTFIRTDNRPFLVSGGQLHCWMPFGYEKAIHHPAGREVTVLTPLSTVNAFGAGDRPKMALPQDGAV